MKKANICFSKRTTDGIKRWSVGFSRPLIGSLRALVLLYGTLRKMKLYIGEPSVIRRMCIYEIHIFRNSLEKLTTSIQPNKNRGLSAVLLWPILRAVCLIIFFAAQVLREIGWCRD